MKRAVSKFLFSKLTFDELGFVFRRINAVAKVEHDHIHLINIVGSSEKFSLPGSGDPLFVGIQ